MVGEEIGDKMDIEGLINALEDEDAFVRDRVAAIRGKMMILRVVESPIHTLDARGIQNKFSGQIGYSPCSSDSHLNPSLSPYK